MNEMSLLYLLVVLVFGMLCLSAWFLHRLVDHQGWDGSLVLAGGGMGLVCYEMVPSPLFCMAVISGMILLVAGVILIALAPVLLVIKTHPNNEALEGTQGFIAGSVQRFDERETVFSRNRALRPGSEQFEQFYTQHPEYAEYDAARRKLGGPQGDPVRLIGRMKNRIWRHRLL